MKLNVINNTGDTTISSSSSILADFLLIVDYFLRVRCLQLCKGLIELDCNLIFQLATMGTIHIRLKFDSQCIFKGDTLKKLCFGWGSMGTVCGVRQLRRKPLFVGRPFLGLNGLALTLFLCPAVHRPLLCMRTY